MTTQSMDKTAEAMRRGACPALSAPMLTGDGLLARVALKAAITPAQLAAICRLALEHGSGVMDISARGNLQVRGLSAASAADLETGVRALQLPLREGLAVETPPLAGLDASEIADPTPLAEAIKAGARDIGGLAPKMSVVVDGHGRLRHSHLLADIRLVATATPGDVRWQMLFGGIEAEAGIAGLFEEADAIEATLTTLRRLAAKGKLARGRDIAAGLPRYASVSPATSPFGLHPLSDTLSAIGIGPAFGQARAGDILDLCEMAERLDIRSLRPALDHSLIFFGPRVACEQLATHAAERGFVIRADDPRSAIAACPGSPSCTSASTDTHALARLAVDELGDLLDGSFKLHVTACSKGCAHPQATALALCGTAGQVALIAGKASDAAFATVSETDAASALHRIAALVRAERKHYETSAECLARLNQDRLAPVLTSGNP